MIVYTLAVIHSYNVRLYNNSPTVVVLIGRLMCRVTNIAPHASDTRYTHKENSLKQSQLVDQSELNHIPLLP